MRAIKNMSGTKFNNLIILEEIPGKRKPKRIMRKVKCQCDCGRIIVTSKHHVVHGKTKSCGCIKKNKNNISPGDRFGKLRVICLYNSTNARGRTYYRAKCICDCGNKCIPFVTSLVSGKSKSCGCRRDQYYKNTGENNSCFTGYREISGALWGRYIRRAKNKKLAFNITKKYAWNLFKSQERLCALTKLPLDFSKKGTASLDRIDNSKGYEIGNVQWVHKDINIMRNAWDIEHFINMCKLVAKNNT